MVKIEIVRGESGVEVASNLKATLAGAHQMLGILEEAKAHLLGQIAGIKPAEKPKIVMPNVVLG